MKGLVLQGINFGPVIMASGMNNYLGEGYPFHRCIPWLDFSRLTFVAKTPTLKPRKGNMPLIGTMPKKFKPDCIKVYPFRGGGIVLNAVDLSGPGLGALLETGVWQKMTKPFFIPFMAVGQTRESRILETHSFALKLKEHLPDFQAKIGVQVNISCPNTGHNLQELIEETVAYLKLVSIINVPIDLKISVLTPVDVVKKIVETGLLDSLTVSNSIPWGFLPEKIDWQKIFGRSQSPLAHYGGGALSGAPLLPLVHEWVVNAQRAKIDIPVVAGGGIQYPDDVNTLFGCDIVKAIMVGSVTMLKPWNFPRIVSRAYEVAESRNQ